LFGASTAECVRRFFAAHEKTAPRTSRGPSRYLSKVGKAINCLELGATQMPLEILIPRRLGGEDGIYGRSRVKLNATTSSEVASQVPGKRGGRSFRVCE
jgi:hypothetical protein